MTIMTAQAEFTGDDLCRMKRGQWLRVRCGTGGYQLAVVVRTSQEAGAVFVMKHKKRSGTYTRPMRVSLWECRGVATRDQLAAEGLDHIHEGNVDRWLAERAKREVAAAKGGA